MVHQSKYMKNILLCHRKQNSKGKHSSMKQVSFFRGKKLQSWVRADCNFEEQKNLSDFLSKFDTQLNFNPYLAQLLNRIIWALYSAEAACFLDDKGSMVWPSFKHGMKSRFFSYKLNNPTSSATSSVSPPSSVIVVTVPFTELFIALRHVR